MNVLGRLDEIYRRSGANLPFADPRPSHGAEMEGYFWRLTDLAHRRVVVVLCGVNRHPDGDWATVAIAAHPGGFVSSAVLPPRTRHRTGSLSPPGAVPSRQRRMKYTSTSATEVSTSRYPSRWRWPLALGGGGIFSAVPFLGQYWHPHILGGVARGTAQVADEPWRFDDADVYAEKNWGAGFPQRWWWGQAQGFDRPDVCVAFSGGVLTAGPMSATVGGVVVRVGARVVRLTPPFAIVRSETDGHRWEVRARDLRHRVHIIGSANGEPHVLPVPLPAQRRNADTDLEHLAGHLTLEVSGDVNYRGTTELAALEIGHRPTDNDIETSARADRGVGAFTSADAGKLPAPARFCQGGGPYGSTVRASGSPCQATFARFTSSRSLLVVGVAVPPGDVAADHPALRFVGGVVGAVEREVAQRGELGLDAVQPRARRTARTRARRCWRRPSHRPGCPSWSTGAG